MKREELHETMAKLCESVYTYMHEECKNIGASPHSFIIVPLLIAETMLDGVAEMEKRMGIQDTGLGHGMLKHLVPIRDAAYSIAESAWQRRPTEEELQDVAKQIQDMGRFKD